MDPVQLMMAAHQADATVAAQTPDQALQAAIAQSRPDLWAPLSTNPAAYPDLLGWLASTGNVEVLANLRARGYLTDDAATSAAGGVGDAGAAAADAAEDGADADDSGEAGDEQKTDESDEPAEDTEGAEGAETATEPDAEPEVADEAATDADEAQESGTDQPEDEASEEQAAEDAAVDESADERGAEPADAAEEPGTDEAQESGTDQPEDEASEEQAAEDAAADESADEHSAEPAETAEEPGTDEPAEDTEGAETATEPDAEDAAVDDDSGEAGDEQKTDESDEDSEDSEDVEDDEAGSPDSEDQHVEDTAVAVDDGEPGTEGPAEDSEDSDAAETAVDPDVEGAVDESADSDHNDTTVLATASQRHEVDSTDTTDVTASAQSAAVTSGWTAGSAAPAAGSAESVAFPVPPPPSAEDIAAWAETPSGAPSGFSAAQPAVELDMFGPQMMAQMPPPQQKQPSKSSSGRLIAIIVVLLLVIVGGGGLWAGSHFANKDKSEDTSQYKADSDGNGDGKQNGQADAAATSTAAALPSGAVKACSSMPTFTITSVEDGQGELKVHGNMATSCAEGDFLAGSSSQVLVYSSTSPTGGADVDHLVASGTFDLSSDPLIIPNGGRAVTLRFGEQHYFRTAKDLDLKGLTVRPSFDRGSSSTATAKSSTNSAMTIASSASSNANQEAQDEQAAGDAIQWQIKHDYPIVMNSLRGKWTPQLSSKQVGLVADGQTWTKRSILAEYLRTQQANPKAVIIDTSQWPVYDTGGWWVTLQGDTYSDGDQANAWCDAQGYDSDHCLAKRIESNGTSQGTTKLR